MTLEEIDTIFDGERHFNTELTVGEVIEIGILGEKGEKGGVKKDDV